MDNFLKSDAVNFKDEWQTVSNPVLKSDLKEDENNPQPSADEAVLADKKRSRLISPVLTFQLVLCLLVLTFAFLTKNFFYDFYANLKAYYDRELNASMYFSGNLSDLDYSGLFEASDDEF